MHRNVTVARKADFGQNDRVTTVRSHLGALLKPGDAALGYDLAAAAPSDDALDAAVESGRLAVPDALLVRKSHDAARARRRAKGERRPWVLKRLDLNGGGGGDIGGLLENGRGGTIGTSVVVVGGSGSSALASASSSAADKADAALSPPGSGSKALRR